MADFGHIHGNSGGAYFDAWGRGPFLIIAGGKEYLFEDSDMFGPALLKKNGELRANPYPPERSPFWASFSAWRNGGRKVEADGKTCALPARSQEGGE